MVVGRSDIRFARSSDLWIDLELRKHGIANEELPDADIAPTWCIVM